QLGPTPSVTSDAGIATITARPGFTGCTANATFRNLHGPVWLSPFAFDKVVDIEPYHSIFTVVDETRLPGESGIPGIGIEATIPPPGAMTGSYAPYFIAGCAV